MWRAAAAVMLVGAACAGPGDDGPVLVVPSPIAIPYVAAGAGPSTIEVAVSNPGDADVTGPDGGGLVWQLGPDADFTVVDAPAAVAAGATVPLVIAWAGADAPCVAGATLTVASNAGTASAEVWAVAGDPALDAAVFEPVEGPGGVHLGDSAVVSMPTAPFPAPGRPWTDDRVHLFVPVDYRERDAHDVVLHFHGHNTTIDATVPGHLYREQVHASGADVILLVPQGPVEAASGDFGKLMDPAGTAAFLDQAIAVLYRAGAIHRPVLGQVTLTSHSGGYAAVAANLDPEASFFVGQVDLFDSLYGYASTYLAFARTGAPFRSNYTAGGGTLPNNTALIGQLTSAGVEVATETSQRNLRDVPSVVYFTAASHGGATRDDTAYGEQLRWSGRHSRRGPRPELRSAVAAGGRATVTWLAPDDDDLTGWRVEVSSDGAAWSSAARVDRAADRASFDVTGGVRVRVVPEVDGVAPERAQPSDTYRVDPDAAVLVVDGFDRVVDGSWGGLAHDFAAVVGEAAGPVHGVSSRAVIEDGFDLSPYRVVVWLVGDESTGDHSFTAAEQAAIEAYLAGGGRVVLSGSEIGYELGPTSAGATWLSRVAGAVHAADDAGTGSAVGAGRLAGVAAFDFGGAAAPYREEFPDTYTAGAGAEVALRYATGAAAAVGVPGRAVVVGFPLEVIEQPAARVAVVAGLIGFVDP